LPAVLEIPFIEPHAVHDDRELSHDSNARLFHADPFTELESGIGGDAGFRPGRLRCAAHFAAR
jgi:hypothetical protein